MSAFIKTTLSKVCSLVTDGTHDTPKVIEKGFPLIKAKEIVGGIINFEDCDHISKEEHLKVISRSHPEYLNILFAHIGASLGETALIKTKREFSIKNVALFKPDSNKINSKYLYYYIKGSQFQNSIKNRRTGSAQPFVSLEFLRNHPIEIHSDKIVQRKISGMLSKYDDLIEKNTQRIQILEEMAQRIYREWFVHFRYPGHENDKLVESELGMIPEGWEIGTLSNIADLKRERFKEENHRHFPLLDLARIPRRNCSITDFGESDEITTARIIFREDDILFGAIRPYFHKVVYCPVDGVTNTSVFVIKPQSPYAATYLFSLFFSDFTVAWATQHSGGTKMPVIKWDVFKNMAIVLPLINMVEMFDREVKPILDEIANFIIKNQNLRKTRDLLLSRLISGKIDVSELDIDIGETDESL